MQRQPNLDTEPVRCLYATRPDQRPGCELTAVVRYGSTALCAHCATHRSTLGKGEAGHQLPPQRPLDVLRWIAQADQQLRDAQTELTAATQRARTQGHSWSAIAAILNITRQAAQQRFGHHPTRRPG